MAEEYVTPTGPRAYQSVKRPLCTTESMTPGYLLTAKLTALMIARLINNQFRFCIGTGRSVL